jgi:hypothetical protein
MTSIADNPDALAAFVENLGGTIVAAPTFRFQIPLGETRRIIPEINRLGLKCERVSEHQGVDPYNGNAISIATIELRRQPEKDSYDEHRALMAAVCR